MKDATTRVKVLALCGLHFVFGLILAPMAGIQNDEALFANPIYQNSFEFSVHIFHHTVPVMVMSYIGTLKTALYWVIFHFVSPSALSVRLPMILLGSITIFLFYCLAQRIAGARAAWIGAVLLATDQTFLLTNTFDWGPVAIEHFLIVTACLLAVRFADSGRKLFLAGAFFLLGLAIWNKAIFVWSLAGLSVAAGVALLPEIRKRLKWRTAAIAVAAFIVGSSPFLYYNLKRPNATLSQNARLEIPDWNNKFFQVRMALTGESLFGYIANEDSAEHVKPANSILGRAVSLIHSTTGERRRGLLGYAVALSILAVPLWWKSRAARFALTFCVVTWLMMAVTHNSGTSPHHVVLLWPFPHLLVAITLAAIPWRLVAPLATVAIASANLLVWNEYVYKLEHFGAGKVFTDAIYPLSARVVALHDAAGRPVVVYVTDWGIWNTLTLMEEGRIRITGIDDLFPEHVEPNKDRDDALEEVLANRDAIFLGHTAGEEVFLGMRERIDQTVAAAGLSRQILEVVKDSNERPMFEIFRLVER